MARYTLIVGTRNWSSWSLRPYVALKAAGAPFDVVDIRLRQTDAPTTREQILKHSPAGKVPVLKIEEAGKVLTVWDSLAICETVAERHPEAQLWPKDAGARATARSYACEMHSGFPDVRDQLTLDFARRQPMPELRPETKTQIDRILSSWDGALAAHKGEFLFGKLSVADCMYAPVATRFKSYEVPIDLVSSAYIDTIYELPAFRQWLDAALKESWVSHYDSI